MAGVKQPLVTMKRQALDTAMIEPVFDAPQKNRGQQCHPRLQVNLVAGSD